MKSENTVNVTSGSIDAGPSETMTQDLEAIEAIANRHIKLPVPYVGDVLRVLMDSLEPEKHTDLQTRTLACINLLAQKIGEVDEPPSTPLNWKKEVEHG